MNHRYVSKSLLVKFVLHCKNSPVEGNVLTSSKRNKNAAKMFFLSDSFKQSFTTKMLRTACEKVTPLIYPTILAIIC